MTSLILRPGKGVARGRGYLARASLVYQSNYRFRPGAYELEQLADRCNGLKIGVLHASPNCHHLRREPARRGQTFILSLGRHPLVEILPKCPKCCL